MVDIQKLVIGQLQSNCYLVIDKKIKQLVIVDPGDDADFIIRKITDLNATPVKIIATHGHFDHILAAGELKLAYNIPFFIHKKDKFLVKRMNQTAKFFTGVEVGPPPKVDGFLKDGQKISLGDSTFNIIATPGHTPGSICLYHRKEKLLIAGDLIFANGGVGRTDFSYSSQEKLNKSIAKILKLSSETKIYPGHGPETTIAKEQEIISSFNLSNQLK